MFIDRKNFTLRAQLDLGCVIIGKGNSAAMAFEFTTDDNDLLAYKLIAHKSILARNSILLFGVWLHELSPKNLRISTTLHEYTVRLRELLVPQEQIVLVAVLDCANEATMLAFDNFDHLVDGQRVVVLVSAIEGSVARGQGHLFAELNNFDVYDLALLIDHGKLVFMHLENQACILASVVEHKVVRFETVASTVLPS